MSITPSSLIEGMDMTEKDTRVLRNVYVARLPITNFTDADLYDLVVSFGPVISARIMRAKGSGQSKGYAFVLFERPEDAARCITELTGHVIRDPRYPVECRYANNDACQSVKMPSSAKQHAKAIAAIQRTLQPGPNNSGQQTPVATVSPGVSPAGSANNMSGSSAVFSSSVSLSSLLNSPGVTPNNSNNSGVLAVNRLPTTQAVATHQVVAPSLVQQSAGGGGSVFVLTTPPAPQPQQRQPVQVAPAQAPTATPLVFAQQQQQQQQQQPALTPLSTLNLPAGQPLLLPTNATPIQLVIQPDQLSQQQQPR